MLFDTEYKTIVNTAIGLYKEKGSKFIAISKPLKNIEEFKTWADEIKIEYPGAVHYCYAYRLGYEKQLYRINDDGEPSGSAGRPIYNIILSNDLTNIGIIVVRYFGGTLLGVPGLIRAYKEASIESIQQNEIITKTIIEKAEIEFVYEKMNDAMRIIKEHQLKITAQESESTYKITIELPLKNAERIRAAFSLYAIKYKYLSTD